MKLPAHLIRTLKGVHPDAEEWLTAFPSYLEQLETAWNIRVLSLVEDLSFNVVALAEGDDGTPYILKMSPPGGEFSRELAALRLYDGDGIAKLIRADEQGGAMLLERLQPGVSFWRTDDDELATRTCAELLLQLWRPVEDMTSLRDLTSWTRALPAYLEQNPNGGALPQNFARKANDLLTELLQEQTDPVLLHADLHHGNILSATRQPYLAIDPKGIVGARAFDVTAFLRNPYDLTKRADFKRVLETRLSIFSEMLGLSKEELARWGYMFCALSSCWSVEDGQDGENGLKETLGVAGGLEDYF